MKKRFSIKGMTCAACQSHIEKAVKKLNGINKAEVNLLTNTMDVDFEEERCSIQQIISTVENEGYEANIEGKKIQRNNLKDYNLIKLIVSFAFLVILMYVSMGHMYSWPMPWFLSGFENSLNIAMIQLLCTIPIVLLNQQYFINGFKRLFKLSPNMDSLIALGSSAAIIYGVYSIFMIGYGLGHQNENIVNEHVHNLYFESAGMILTLVSLGKFLENIAKKKTTKSIEKIATLTPKTALVKKEGKEIILPVENIKVNDIVVCRKGDKIPVDGRIISGSSSINESNFTGESIPNYKTIGDEVFASTIVDSGYIEIKVEKNSSESSISIIAKMVEEAANSKAPISKLADKVSLFFVPAILLISISVLAGFLIAGYSFESAFNFSISVLVIACPCALGLATPVSIMVGTGKAAENGLLIKNAEILEKAHDIKTVIMDKTGTITYGKPTVTNYIDYRNDQELKSIILSIESLSEHPLANAIVSYCQKENCQKLSIYNYEAIDGQGLKARYKNDEYSIGNKEIERVEIDNQTKLIINEFENEGKTVLYVYKNKELAANIAIKDEIKPSSISAIKKMQSEGIKVVMLTGDNKTTANAIAKELGIDETISQVLPKEKQDVLTKYCHESKNTVAMVGDGVNDALALATADIGIAIGAGSDIAKESADIVLARNDLMDVYHAIKISKRTIHTIIFSLFWAFFYNCIGVFLATGALYPSLGIKLNPMIASLAMSFSSVFVVLTALTIGFYKINKNTKGDKKMEKIVFIIEDMMCAHCQKHIEEAVKKCSGVEAIHIDLKQKTAIIKGENLNKNEIVSAIKNAGYNPKIKSDF